MSLFDYLVAKMQDEIYRETKDEGTYVSRYGKAREEKRMYVRKLRANKKKQKSERSNLN